MYCAAVRRPAGATTFVSRRKRALQSAAQVRARAQVCVPKAVLQQLCHRHRPPWPPPRFTRLSRPGDACRYSCTIAFPQARRRKGGGGGGEKGAPDGPRTWQLREDEDGWPEVQEAQNAVALRALLELLPDVEESYRLEPRFRRFATARLSNA